MNLHDAISGFTLACIAENKSSKTIRGYQDTLDLFEQEVGNIQVEDLKPDHLRRFMADETKRKAGRIKIDGALSPSTLHKRYSVCRTFLRWCYMQGYTDVNITNFTKAPRVPNDLPDALTEEEVKKILNFVRLKRDPRDRCIIEFFLDTGARLNELVQLSLQDLNLNEGYAIIEHGKGDKERVVPLGKSLRKDLHNYIYRYRFGRYGENAVFVNRDGSRLGKEGVSMMVRRILTTLQVKGKHGPHTLRHTFATMFLRKTGDLETLRKILGHTDIKITARYTHLMRDDILDAHRRGSPLDNL
jgi:site-specific recombinase XerD